MASEILAVPEQHLKSVIQVIQAGLKHAKPKPPRIVHQQLSKWCKEESEYLKRIGG